MTSCGVLVGPGVHKVTSEPCNPWMASTASQFSTELYQCIPQELTDDRCWRPIWSA